MISTQRTDRAAYAALYAGAAGLLAPAAQGAVVTQVFNERIAPGAPDLDIANEQSSVTEDSFDIDLDGTGGADVRVYGRSTFERAKRGERDAVSSLQLTALQGGTAIELVEDGDDGRFGEEYHTEDFGIADVIGPDRSFYGITTVVRGAEVVDDRLLLYQDFSDTAFGATAEGAAFSVFYEEAEDADGDGTVDGPLFVGFRLDAGSDSYRYGFLQFDDVDSDDDPVDADWTVAFDSAATLVGFALETNPDTAITTFDVIPEPGTLALLAAGGACLLTRRRAA